MLAESGEWSKLLTLTETQTSGGGHGELAPRFWWVRASAALNAAPLSILAAPLETVTREIAELRKRGSPVVTGELVNAAAQFLAEMSRRLFEQRETATACGFAERAFRLDPTTRPALEHVVEAVLAQPAPSARRDPAGVRLRTRCEELRRELGPPAAALAAAALVSQPLAAPVQETPRPSAVSPAVEHSVSKSGGVSARFAVLAVGAAIAVGFYLAKRSSEGEMGDFEAAMALSAFDQEPGLSPPPIERLASISQLDAIFYDFDRGGARRDAPAAAPSAASARAASAAPAVVVSGGRESVDTAGPLEPEDVLKARTQPEEPPEEDVGSILFGAPKPSFPRPQRGAGGTVKPLPVEQFSKPQNYAVLNRTRVMSRPSFKGAAVAELNSGDTVRGDGVVGDWVKVRSRSGQVGYILSQDLRPAY